MQDNNIIDITQFTKPESYAYSIKKLSESKKEDLITEVRKNKYRWYSVFGINISAFRNDKYFYTNPQQWTTEGAENYRLLGKVPYTFNLLKPIVRQLQGEMSSMQPSISLSPRNHEKVDAQLLIMMTDFLRAEMYHHKAADAYNECFLNQCIGGWGVLEIETDYEDAFSFNQSVKVTSSPDPLLVGFDPAAKTKTKADSEWQFKDYYMSKEDFKATYHRDPPAAAQILGAQWEFIPLIDPDVVVVTDYYRTEYKTKTLVQLTNHSSYSVEVLESDINLAQESYMQTMMHSGMMPHQIPPLTIANRRRTKIKTIHCYKCVWDDVLEHKIWPSKWMPFVFVDGNSVTQDGRQYTESFINAARDAQMSYNYTMSEIYNGIPRARREQVYMTRRQAEGHEQWLRYPDRQQGHAEYNFDPLVPNGPIFRAAEELPQSLFLAATNAKQGVYDALGIMPVNGSELPNNLAAATVGRIITQGNLTFAKLLNNLFDAMQQLGETFLDLVPKIYDIERVVNIVDASGAVASATINTLENGQPKNMLADFVYHLEVKPMASFAIQQQELRQNLIQLAQLDPQNPPLVSDLIASTLETPIAPLLAKRLNTLVPPNVTAIEKGLPAPPPAPPNPQVQLVEANIQKTNAQAALAQAKAQEASGKTSLAAQTVQQKNLQNQTSYQLEMHKMALEEAKLNVESQKTQLDNQTELHKAALVHNAKVIPALLQSQKPERQPQN